MAMTGTLLLTIFYPFCTCLTLLILPNCNKKHKSEKSSVEHFSVVPTRRVTQNCRKYKAHKTFTDHFHFYTTLTFGGPSPIH